VQLSPGTPGNLFGPRLWGSGVQVPLAPAPPPTTRSVGSPPVELLAGIRNRKSRSVAGTPFGLLAVTVNVNGAADSTVLRGAPDKFGGNMGFARARIGRAATRAAKATTSLMT